MGNVKSKRLDKLEKVEGPAPGTYDSPSGSRKILPNRNYSFTFSKKKKASYISEIKPRGPDVGAYNIDKSDSFITRGAARGWK